MTTMNEQPKTNISPEQKPIAAAAVAVDGGDRINQISKNEKSLFFSAAPQNKISNEKRLYEIKTKRERELLYIGNWYCFPSIPI